MSYQGRRAGSDGSMCVSGSAGPGFDPRRGSQFSFENFQPRLGGVEIAIRPSDGDVKPGGLLGAFREEQAMSRDRISPYPFLSSSSHTTQLHYTNSYPYIHPNLNFLQ